MSNDKVLEKVKKLRELTGVGFKDCKNAIDENNGDVEKSIEFLRKKGIAKANKKMERVAADGLVSITENQNKFSIIEVNSETDFVAKNEEEKNIEQRKVDTSAEENKAKDSKKILKKKGKVTEVKKISKSFFAKVKSLTSKKEKK